MVSPYVFNEYGLERMGIDISDYKDAINGYKDKKLHFFEDHERL